MSSFLLTPYFSSCQSRWVAFTHRQNCKAYPYVSNTATTLFLSTLPSSPLHPNRQLISSLINQLHTNNRHEARVNPIF